MIASTKYRTYVIITAWLIVTIALLYGAILVGAVKDIPGLIVASVLPNFVLYSYHRGDYERFLMTMQLREALLENKRFLIDEKASDLRAMIGNVAHDLKTVRNIQQKYLVFYSHLIVIYCICIIFIFIFIFLSFSYTRFVQ
jgi:hypothetical protein